MVDKVSVPPTFKNDVIYCSESWHIAWDWLARDWSTFGWHKMRYAAEHPNLHAKQKKWSDEVKLGECDG